MKAPVEVKTYSTRDAAAFLNGTATDDQGRTVEDYMSFTNDKWEECHNHVQWAFPSHVKSQFNPNAPVVDMDTLVDLITIEGYANLNRLVDNYLLSLGFTQDKRTFTANLEHDRARIWVTPFNHNYQRISRLLNLLSWTDPDRAMHLLNEVLNVAKTVSNWTEVDQFHRVLPYITVDTVVYWSKAAIGKL